ncbi:MAG: 4-phosphoerythronate dehydrogenase [Lentisphaerae bacterium]|nr:4-phosphoerythronate dehydrogenase [Lentisphaerota bacterium]
MKIVIDDRIPFIRGVFEPFASVVYLPGKSIAPADVADADALIVRTRTRCDKALLGNSKVRFVATATIGFDHINADELTQCGIQWSNAPGCNAVSVKNYIASALAAMDIPLSGKTMGIVGVGHVGSKVAVVAGAFGMNVLLNDPPRADREGREKFVELDELLAKSDIVTLHVPLESGGKYPTVNMADEAFFRKMRSGAWFFNSCRGEAVQENALIAAVDSGKLAGVLMDVWPGEPDMSRKLLDSVTFGTPHIAGYSADGKANGTTASVRYIAGKLGIEELADWRPGGLPEPVYPAVIDLAGCDSASEAVKKAVLHAYDIRRDTTALAGDPAQFEKLRGTYWVRREFSAYTVINAPEDAVESLKKLDFKVGI